VKFHYQAFDPAGNLIEGDVDASSPEEARAIVRSRGATPYAVRGARALDVLFRDITINRSGGRARDADLARLARDLAVLLQAGVPLDAALQISSATTDDKRMSTLTLRLREGVLGGSSLADAMEAMGRTFRSEYVRIVQAGEIGANLGAAMQDLADLLDRRVEIKAKVRGAMAYPALLVGLTTVSLWIVLGLLVPAVTPIFLENGVPVPGILAALDAIRRNGAWILGVFTASCAGLALGAILGRRQPATRVLLDRLFLSVPVLGPIAVCREAARFTRTLATLIKAGVPPLQAIQTSCPLVRNEYTRNQLERAVSDVRAGATIGEAMTKAAALPAVARQMIAVGEESGRLQDMLTRAALILERQEQSRTARVLAILTPSITILVSGMIAAIILSVMGAILSINDLALQ
jgi:general secretion pathway protein F